MRKLHHVIGACAAVAIAALLVVGVVSGEIVRHIVQTVPLWPAAVLGLRGKPWAKWTALPVLFFWFAITILIWSFLLGISDLATGAYSPVEQAMAAIISVASIIGLVACHLDKAPGGITAVLAALVLFVVQAGLMALSLQPPLETDQMLLKWIAG